MEPILLKFVLYCQEAGQLIKPHELLQLANSLLEESILQVQLKEFQKSIKNPETGQLSKSWLEGFYHRHSDHLKTRKGYCLSHIYLKDLTEDNIQVMYNLA